jgi:hypothetical protein
LSFGSSATHSPDDRHAFDWTERGGVVDLGLLVNGFSSADLVNDRGMAVGTYFDPNAVGAHTVLWRPAAATKRDFKAGGWQS